MQADGWSLDDKRQPLLSEDKLGVSPEINAISSLLIGAVAVLLTLSSLAAKWRAGRG